MTKGPKCTICNHERYPHIRRRLAEKRSLLSIANETGASYDAIRRHVANDHERYAWPLPAPTRAEPLGLAHDGRQPFPGAVWEFSDDELAFHDAAEADWHAIVERRTGVGAEDLRRCWTTVSGPEHEPCAACDALEANESLLNSIEAARAVTEPVGTPGRWRDGDRDRAARLSGPSPRTYPSVYSPQTESRVGSREILPGRAPGVPR